MKFPQRFLLAAAAAWSITAHATTYYWKPGTTQGVWTSLSNWSTESINGADAAALPGSSDQLYYDGDYNFDLDGGSYSVKGPYVDGSGFAHNMSLVNGTLSLSGETRWGSSTFDINNGATLRLPSGSTFYTGVYSSSLVPVRVNNGGTLQIEGTARFYNSAYQVAAGGTLVFSPTSLRVSTESHGYAIGISNAGTSTFPNGLIIGKFDSGSANAGTTFTLAQTTGTMNLGGPVTLNNQPGTFNVVLSGGTVNATGNVTFDVSSATVENSVTFNVDSGKTINLTPVSFAAGSSIVKSGAGAIVLPATAPTATISAGDVLLQSGTYDLSAVTFAAGSGITLDPVGGRVDSASASIANATFSASLPSTPGVEVFHSTDATLLAKVKSDLDASVPQGFQLVIGNGALSLETAAVEGNTFSGVGSLLNDALWSGNSVPVGGADVAIDGSTTVATLPSGSSFPAWASIEVKNGATLRIEANVAALPSITLNKSATLEIASGATVTLANASDLSGSATANQIPVLSIASGATLNVPGGMKFSNVNIALGGTIETTATGGVTFGYADAGATTYFGLTAVSGSAIAITEGTSSSYGLDPLEFCCPASGGTVVTTNAITLTEVALSKASGYDYSTGHYHGLHLGVNNPTNVPFEVVFDNMRWGVGGKVKIQGGATFRLRNNAAFVNYEHHTAWDRQVSISENGSVVVGEGCEFRVNALGNYGGNAFAINPATTGYEAVAVEDGGIFETYRTSGNSKAVISTSNGVWRIFEPYITNNGEIKTASVPFAGLQSVHIASDSALTFTTRNRQFSWTPSVTDDSGADRVVALADVPITGGGSILVSNANANVFGIVVQSGSNTATGTASVVPPTGAGIGATTLYFADGANWAGTVVATNGLVKLVKDFASATNSAAVPAPVEVSFGGIEMQDDLTLHLWQDGTCDCINIGANGWTGSGKLDFEYVDFAEAGSQKWKIATQPANTTLPVVKKGCFALTTEASATEGQVNVYLKVANGTTILLR